MARKNRNAHGKRASKRPNWTNLLNELSKNKGNSKSDSTMPKEGHVGSSKQRS